MFIAKVSKYRPPTNFNPHHRRCFPGAVSGPPCAHVLVILGAPSALRATLARMDDAFWYLQIPTKYQPNANQKYPKIVKYEK